MVEVLERLPESDVRVVSCMETERGYEVFPSPLIPIVSMPKVLIIQRLALMVACYNAPLPFGVEPSTWAKSDDSRRYTDRARRLAEASMPSCWRVGAISIESRLAGHVIGSSRIIGKPT